ncbi:Ig-like domain (group 2) [Sporobacter termitidis DSM 10068]|uniref:Ig-like domain (Group 2) n=1 Tax=Sporobacter termitidis DSM 10068 TaxID=1123282 RepID=A0A1M5YVW4_9FIRM|nr:Ig-like domain-containing protein [Sporobacter termitidis]SHI15988.1 Ig-like domain (group 2) [Sporobacter termitidis DSM 10068]
MAVISEVKCGRCDRRYSGFRSRCPYCGARRNKRGKHADDTENAKAKVIIGVLLLVVLIAAAMILILSLPGKTDPDAQGAESPTYSDDGNNTSASPGGDANTSDDANAGASTSPSDDANAGASTSPSDDANAGASTSPPIDPNAKVQSVSIMYGGEAKVDVTMKVGETLPLKVKMTPEIEGKVAQWDTSDATVATVTMDGVVKAISKGKTTLTLTIDGVKAECTVRVRDK